MSATVSGNTVVVGAVDAAGVSFATTTVVVPQKPSPASIASVNAQAAAPPSHMPTPTAAVRRRDFS